MSAMISYRNAKSTKTRIETSKTDIFKFLPAIIAMRNPLKQGLKPINSCSHWDIIIIAMRNPLKQGLKQ